jgi:NADH-quinone oxidoreductase subunit M
MLLSLLIWSPLVFAFALLLLRDIRTVKLVTLTSTIISMFLAMALMLPSDRSSDSLKSVVKDQGKIELVLQQEIATLRATAQVEDAVSDAAVLALPEAGYARSLQRDIEAMQKASGLADQLEFIEFTPWIRTFNVNYFLGADGLSIVLVILTCFLFLVCMASCWGMDSEMDHGKPKYPGMKAFYFLYLLLQVGLVGVFLAQDLMLFYVFWEVVLLPMYFLIGIWGGPNRIYAAIKFFIYTLVGSVLMLIAFLYFYLNTGGTYAGGEVGGTFNIVALMDLLPVHFATAKTAGVLCFIGLFVGFAIKVPVVPFHTWLPDAHVQAPTPISMLLAGILLKMGGYGLFRFLYPFMPEQAYDASTIMAVLGAVSIVYGAYCAMGQTDFKRIVAYSSVSHMGYILLGLAAGTKLAMNGAAQQMIAHGISSAMMFGIVGIIYDRAHHRDVNRFGGIMLQMPYYGGMATVAFFASLGLPGLCGFIPEMMTFFGAFQSPIGQVDGEWWMVFTSVRMWTVISTVGIVLTAVYLLWGLQRVFLGPLKNPAYGRFKDMLPREWAAMVPLAAAAILLGVLPSVTLNYLDPSMDVVQRQLMRDQRYAADITGKTLIETTPTAGGHSGPVAALPSPEGVLSGTATVAAE